MVSGGTTPAAGAELSFLCPRPRTPAIGYNARRHLAHWPGMPSVRVARRRRHGSVQEQVRRAGGRSRRGVGGRFRAALLTLRCPAGTCCVRWSRRTRGAGSASRTARWASPSETPSSGCTGTTAWRAAPSPSQVRAEQAAPGGAGSLRVRLPVHVSPAVKYLNAYTGTVLLRCRKDSYRLLCSALPFVRYLESRAQRYPCFLNTLHVGGQEPPGRGGENGALIILATTPWCCSGCDRHSLCVTNVNCFQQIQIRNRHQQFFFETLVNFAWSFITFITKPEQQIQCYIFFLKSIFKV